MLPATLGRWQWNAGFTLNNALGAGEQVYATVGSQVGVGRYGFPKSPMGLIAGGIVVPVMADGTTVAAEYIAARTQPYPVAGVPVTVGQYRRIEARISNPVVLTRRDTVRITGTVDWLSQSLHATDFGIDLSRDDYGAGRLALDWRRSIPGGWLTSSARLSWGMGGREGSALVPLSRQGASPWFTHLEGNMRLDRAVGGGFGFTLVGRGQTAFGKPQLVAEQFSLDSRDGVSAFTSGTFNADSGLTVRGELNHALTKPAGPVALDLYVYAANGWGWLAQPTATESGSFNAGAVGGGARFSLNKGGAAKTIGVEIGRRFSDIPRVSDGIRANIAVGVRF